MRNEATGLLKQMFSEQNLEHSTFHE